MSAEQVRRPLPARGEGASGDLSELDLRPDVLEALESAFPDSVVEPVGDEGWLTEVLPGLANALSRLPGARLLYERAPEGEWGWSEEVEDDLGDVSEWSEWEEPDWDHEDRSYALFFRYL